MTDAQSSSAVPAAHPAGTAASGPRRFVCAVDLGKRKDATAAAMLEPTTGVILHRLARWPGGSSYADQGAGIRALVDRARRLGPVEVLFDVTNGIGAQVVSEVAAHVAGVASVWFVMITGGYNQRLEDQTWSVPKVDLVSAAQMALEGRRLQIATPSNPEEARDHQFNVELFRTELEGFKMTAKDSGRMSYDNDARIAPHDDLVLAGAIGLAWIERGSGGSIVTSSSQLNGSAGVPGRDWWGNR